MTQPTHKTTKTLSHEKFDPESTQVPGFSYRLCRLLATCDIHGKGFLKNASTVTGANQSAIRRWVFEDHIPGTISQVVHLVARISQHSKILDESNTVRYVSWLMFGDDVGKDPTRSYWNALVEMASKWTKEAIDRHGPSELDEWDRDGIRGVTASILDQALVKGSELKSPGAIDEEVQMLILRMRYGNPGNAQSQAS